MKKQSPRAVELWMAPNLAAGAATAAFLSLLVPPFVLQQTGSALRSGIVLAVVGLAAVSGPLWGKLADKHGAHRLLYLLSALGMVASYLILALDAGIDWYSPIFGVLLGLSLAVQGTVGPAFIIGAGLPKPVENRQLTATNLAMPLGQVLGAAIIALGQLAGFGYIGLFWLATALLAVLALLAFIGIAKPDARLKAARQAYETQRKAADALGADVPKVPKTQPGAKQKGGFRAAMASSFGVLMLVVVVSSFSNNGLTSQIANILPGVYGFSGTQTSGLIGLAGVLNLAVIFIFGRVMARTGPMAVFVIGTGVRLVGVLLMALVGLLGTGHLLAAAIAVQVAYQGSPISRLPAPLLAARLSPAGAAEANGYYFGASALGGFLGCLAVGFTADAAGFNAVNWVAAIAGAAAMALLCLWLLPLTARRPAKQKANGTAQSRVAPSAHGKSV